MQMNWTKDKEIVFRNSKKYPFLKIFSSIMFQKRLWENNIWGLVFEVSKVLQNFDYN